MSGRLGSVFDDVAVDGDRGPDLRWRVSVPASAVGDPAGAAVVVPLRMETDDGVVVARATNPADQGKTVRIQVPAGVEFPVVLRLRGLGGIGDAKPPGDLYLTVDIGGVPATTGGGAPRALIGAGTGVAVVALLALLLGYCG